MNEQAQDAVDPAVQAIEQAARDAKSQVEHVVMKLAEGTPPRDVDFSAVYRAINELRTVGVQSVTAVNELAAQPTAEPPTSADTSQDTSTDTATDTDADTTGEDNEQEERAT